MNRVIKKIKKAESGGNRTQFCGYFCLHSFAGLTKKVSFLPQKQSFREHYEGSSWDQCCFGKTTWQYFSVISLCSHNPMNEHFIKDHNFFIAHIFFMTFIMLAGTSSKTECVSKVWTTLHQSFTSKDTYVRKGTSSVS